MHSLVCISPEKVWQHAKNLGEFYMDSPQAQGVFMSRLNGYWHHIWDDRSQFPCNLWLYTGIAIFNMSVHLDQNGLDVIDIVKSEIIDMRMLSTLQRS